MDLLTGKIISMVLLGALSLFFGLIPLRIQKRLMKTDEGKPAETQKKQRRRRDLVVSCLLCFGAGVLLATVFIHMLPETRENVALINKEHYGKDAKHEHLRDDRGLEAMQGMDDPDVEGSGYPTSPPPGMMRDSNNNPVRLTSDLPAAGSVLHEHHSHDDSNHVHRRSAGDMINEDLAPTTAGSSKLNVDTTERNQHGDHGNHHGNHDHGSHDLDHEASGMPHLKENETLELTEGSGRVTETVTESLAAFEAESATREGEVVVPGATTDNNVDGPLHNDHGGHLHAEGDDHDHNHAHDHTSHDHADHDHSGHDHDHKEERTDKDLKEAKGPDSDTAGGRNLIDHSGHLHDHNNGPYDRTHANLQLNENLPRTSESPHDHHEHDHENDLGSEVLPLHKGGNDSSSAAIHDVSGHEHHDHGEHGAHDHDSLDHAHAHGEHEHEHEAHSYPIAELLICLGFFFVYLVEEIVHKVVFHQHSHSASKRGSKNDGGIVLKNRHSEEDRLPPVTNGTYRSRSVHSNVHPYAAENGSAASGDFNAMVNSGDNLPPKDVWSTSGVDNPSFVNETEVDGQMSRVSVTPHTVGHGHSHMADISELKSQDWVSNLRSLIIVLALSFHAVFEGLAVGLQQNVQDVWYLFYAIAAHKLVIAFCVGLELISGGTKVLLTVVYMVVFALVTPLGIAIGIIVTEGTSSPKSFGHMWTVTVLQGIAGGTILYVTFCEVLERERNRKNGRFLKFFALIIGFSTMAIIELVGAHKHSH